MMQCVTSRTDSTILQNYDSKACFLPFLSNNPFASRVQAPRPTAVCDPSSRTHLSCCTVANENLFSL